MEIKISVIIISKNEESMISDCIKSAKWAFEIIVIDTGSTDKTIQLSQKNGALVYKYAKGKHFSDFRNYGATKAKGNWLLYVDADERIPEKLKEEISNLINFDSEYSSFAIKRKNNLLGHDMRFGGWWPDYVLRLIKKDSLIKWTGELHEQPKIKGKIGKSKNYLYHIAHRDLSQMIEKTNKWSEIEAKLMYNANHPKMNVRRFLSAMFREFFYRGVIKLGFLDGPIGIVEIIYQTFSRFVSYSKLWELQVTKKQS